MKTLLNQCDKEEILTRVRTVRPDSARLWGKMSAHQMICHLSDGCRLYMGLVTVTPPGFPYPSRFVRWTALWTPSPWPKGRIKTPRELDQQTGGTAPADFQRDQEELAALTERFARASRDFDLPPSHPFMGRMSERGWMRLGYLHADHHLRQFGA